MSTFSYANEAIDEAVVPSQPKLSTNIVSHDAMTASEQMPENLIVCDALCLGLSWFGTILRSISL